MSAIAARKARLASQEEAGSSTSSLSSDNPSFLIPLVSKRKGKTNEGTRPEKLLRQASRVKRNAGETFRRKEGKERNATKQNIGKADPRRPIKEAETVQLRQESGEEDDLSIASSDDDDANDDDDGGASIEGVSGLIDATEVSEVRSVCSTYVPMKEGKRKNWHVEQQGPDKQGPTKILTIGLAPGETLLFVGKAILRVLDGHCTVSGAILTSEHRSVIIFAPQNAPLPIIQARPSDPLCKAVPASEFAADHFSAVLEIRSLPSTGIDDIAKACPLVRSNSFASPYVPSSTVMEGFHPIFQAVKGLVSCYHPPSWSRALSSMANVESPIVCLIKGPKRVGKSTFSRYLLNRLLSKRSSRVAYLETDLGQTEFGPPGLISLHVFGSLHQQAGESADLIVGPSWTSLRSPLRSHFLGDVTPKDDPKLYIEAIYDLVQLYRNELYKRGVPLIVNTQGWVKGLGANLFTELEGMIFPSHIVDMILPGDESNLSGKARKLTHSRAKSILTTVEAAPLSLTRDRGLNAVEARTLNIISYFYSTSLPGPSSGPRPQQHDDWPLWDFSVPLLQQRPYIINVEVGLRAGLHVLGSGAGVEKRLQLMALNGSCVAVNCIARDVARRGAARGVEADGNLKESDVAMMWKAALSRSRPPVPLTNCVALGIIRSIDMEKGDIHLLCPLSPHHLAACNLPGPGEIDLCLVKGTIEVPVWLSLNYQLIEASQNNQIEPTSAIQLEGMVLSEVPYLDFEHETENKEIHVIGLGKRRIRRNILRKGQQGDGMP
ncbi:hypothetical protein CBS101457_003741 [Exobasidium rhododendri]|nr:hypothetical protein CBS101457_003741 [Exobasidium rhododendri]